ncbi:MAG: sulfite exporter TauE/SafE family protein [Myxococcota bacterium]|nr:sulfite exporter TauE/SafE family protein [Myxococcota bacterium]
MDGPPTALGLPAAIAMGFLGSPHCLGMCGGIAGAFDSALGGPGPALGAAGRHALLSLGRIGTYALLGAAAGALGLAAGDLVGVRGGIWLRIAFGLAMVLVGMHVAAWWNGLAALEAGGLSIWRRVVPLFRSVTPADRVWKVLALGALWGWLPCGLVYAALAGAIAAGSGVAGATFMAGFGLGTLPMLVATGVFADRLRRVSTRASTRRTAGALLVAFGLWTAGSALLALGGSSHAGHDHVGCVQEEGDLRHRALAIATKPQYL